MSGLPYFQFYPTDFIEGVRELNAEQVGVYTLLLCAMYQGGGEVRDDSRLIRRLTGIAPQKWPRLRQQLIDLGKLSIPAPGFLSNGRVIREIMKQAERAGLRREANSRGGMTTAMRRAEAQTRAVTPPVTPPVTPRVAGDNALKNHDTGAVDSETQNPEKKESLLRKAPPARRTGDKVVSLFDQPMISRLMAITKRSERGCYALLNGWRRSGGNTNARIMAAIEAAEHHAKGDKLRYLNGCLQRDAGFDALRVSLLGEDAHKSDEELLAEATEAYQARLAREAAARTGVA
jgi:uncharacterized protein YdaU (DUF1376 family)